MKTLNTAKRISANKKIIVPRHFRDKDGSSRQMGVKAEQSFWMKCNDKKYTWQNATKDENCTQHIDCRITHPHLGTISVDVKAAKKISRRDMKAQDTWTWIEWTARNGKPGWGRSQVDYIAFQMLTGDFLMVNREELQQLVQPLIEAKKHIVRVESQHHAKNGILWRRAGNKDEMTLIPPLRKKMR